MPIVVFIGADKKTIRVPCTACGGKRRVPFIDRTRTEAAEEIKPEEVAVTDMIEGWRKYRE